MSSGGGGDNGLGGEGRTLRSGVKAGGNMLLGGGGRAIVGGFALSTATSYVLQA